MAWRRSGDKPLSETMMVSLLTHICVTRPQWVNRDSSFQNAQWFGHTTKNAQQRIKCHQFFRFFAYIPFTQGLRPLGLPCATTKLARSPLKAEGRPNGCHGRSRVAHRTFRHRHGRHGRHGRREVLSMFKTIAQRSLRRSVAQRRQDEGTHIAVIAEWMQWSAIGRPIKNANIVYQFERQVCLPCTTIVPPLADQWRPLGDHCASIQRPRQHLSHHGNGSAFTLPSLRDLLCHYSSFGRSRKAQGSCCSSYTETELSRFRRPLSVLTIFMVTQRWHEGCSPV